MTFSIFISRTELGFTSDTGTGPARGDAVTIYYSLIIQSNEKPLALTAFGQSLPLVFPGAAGFENGCEAGWVTFERPANPAPLFGRTGNSEFFNLCDAITWTNISQEEIQHKKAHMEGRSP